MTQEDKQLLMTDLCARLPYRVKLKIREWKTPVELTIIKHSVLSGNYIINENYKLDDIKPYLRPMCSMTEEEKKEYHKTLRIEPYGNGYVYVESVHSFDWLDKKMFDYRGLIQKDRAIEVTDNNNPYKD